MLDAVEVETGRNPIASVIWLHGLGADGHDFEPMVPELALADDLALRFVFPHAPVRAVTLNAGHQMRAWYDIASLDRGMPQDAPGIRGSQAAVHALIEREVARGIDHRHIVLAGFSQGGALAVYAGTRYPHTLAGICGLSCYSLLPEDFSRERHAANFATPMFLAHGTHDPIVSMALGEGQRRLLEAAGCTVEWHGYPMPHAVCAEEIAHIAAWLRRVLR